MWFIHTALHHNMCNVECKQAGRESHYASTSGHVLLLNELKLEKGEGSVYHILPLLCSAG